MIESDTIKLLRECDAGIKMGVKSIDDVTDHVQNPDLQNLLYTNKDEHIHLDHELQQLLDHYGDEGKAPNFLAEQAAKLKTEFKLGIHDTDQTVADLMTDGCNMGVKSLSKYLNQYTAADEKSKDLTRRLINLEERLAIDLRQYL